ncbi:HXXEE domain-containing protein [Lentilactobacillus hilgardii]|uniref:HXXEE domain-containing protein n=1 Tax=Lentilactobacillus hilgardii TaxID=1588 RepID=UPI0021C2E35A|nr:HXXEE domain-containing protein [Lentilactobacillus hilgardii]MCP9333899.1 HXXEE domain-containing protein [Lentilactobacillus hilgardii]MCP9350498.1 HXXEE domain-containing protein [Lentilactobacillus hilgardii]MCP9353394.1 HXXEE domain-containing protein [Lentilactobacillus hilgardii]
MTIIRILAISTPFAYLIHCLEEFGIPGGFISWYHAYRPALNKQTPFYYLMVNIIAFIIVSISALTSLFSSDYTAIVVASSFLASNAIFTHIVGTFKTHTYSPGIVTGIILYIPICLTLYIMTYTQNLLPLHTLIIILFISMLYELWNFYKYMKKTKSSQRNNRLV